MEVSLVIHFSRILHYKASIVGDPPFMETATWFPINLPCLLQISTCFNGQELQRIVGHDGKPGACRGQTLT